MMCSVLGASHYKVDTDTRTLYKDSRLVCQKQQQKYGKVLIKLDNGKNHATTIWRILFCVKHNIAIDSIPPGICISGASGEPKVISRSEIVSNKNKVVAEERGSFDEMERFVGIMRLYYNGDTLPLLKKIDSLERSVVKWLRTVRGYSVERSQFIAEVAKSEYLDRLERKTAPPYCFQSMKRFALGEIKRQRLKRVLNDNYTDKTIED